MDQFSGGGSPIWGQTGVSSSTTTGSVNMYGNYGSYSGTTFYTPTYGITGFTSGTTTSTQYNRAVHLDIFDNQPSSINPSKIYESKVISTGSCGVISEVIDEMFDALFRNFRGESGSSNKYMIEGTFNC